MGIDFSHENKQMQAELRVLRARVRELETAERERGSSDGFHAMLFAQSHMLVAFMDTEFNFLSVNDAYARADEKTPDFFTGRNHFSLFPNDENEAIFRRVVETGEPHHSFAKAFEYAENPERGVSHWDWSLVPLRDADLRVSGLVLTLVDVTERITMTENNRRMLEDQRRLGMAIEQAYDAVVITDAEATIQYVNPAFERCTGYSREEVIGGKPSLLKSGRHDETFYREMWQTLCAAKVWRGVFVNRRKDGSLFEEKATISPVRNEEGKIIHFVGVKRDTTKEMRLERDLRQSQKLQAVGTLAGGIAHDFNNLLQVISANLSVLGQMLPEEEQTTDILSDLNLACDRASELVKQILTFSRQNARRRGPTCICEDVTEALELMRATLPATVELSVDLDKPCGEVLADPTEITQLVMNLCTNAAQAMPDSRGRIEVKVSDRRLAAGELESVAPGSYVQMIFRDDGVGMEPRTRDRIFEPYFTTRDREKGTGMGLAIVHGLVEGSGGSIHVESAPDMGSCFTVLLPHAESDAASVNEEDGQVVKGRGERVLYVDDEEMVVAVMVRGLTLLGYRVDHCARAEKALELFRADPAGIGAVVTDQTMPGMTGLELIGELQAIRPDLPVLLCTGYSTSADEERALAAGASAFLAKPFGIEELATAIRRVLPKPAGS